MVVDSLNSRAAFRIQKFFNTATISFLHLRVGMLCRPLAPSTLSAREWKGQDLLLASENSIHTVL